MSTRCNTPSQGYYLYSNGQPMPCPFGEYKAAIGTAEGCTPCAAGVTTGQLASTSAADCKFLLPSRYATGIDTNTGAITGTALCPRGFFCTGGPPKGDDGKPTFTLKPILPTAFATPGTLVLTNTTVSRCPDGSTTKDEGMSSDSFCRKWGSAGRTRESAAACAAYN